MDDTLGGLSQVMDFRPGLFRSQEISDACKLVASHCVLKR